MTIKMSLGELDRVRETIELAVKSVWPFTGPEVKVSTELMTCSGQHPRLSRKGKEVYGSWPIARLEVQFYNSACLSITMLQKLSRVVKRLTNYEFQYLTIEKTRHKYEGFANIRLAFDNISAAEIRQ